MDPKTNPNPDVDTSDTGPAGGAFYNVMPEDMSGPQVVSDVQPEPAAHAPELSAQDFEDTAANEPTKFSLPHSNRKLFMIMGLVAALAILGVFGFFGYRYAQQQKNANQDEFIVANNNTNQEQDDDDVKSGVTTPPEWQKRYFSSEECLDMNVCADAADPDRDGLSNLEEYEKKTDPNNPDSDSDGLADGDEVHIFGGSPLTNRTNSAEEYLDSDYAKGGYDIVTNVKFSETQLKDIKTRIKDKGLHQPTIKTLGAEYLKQYDFVDPGSSAGDSSAIDSTLDQSPTAKLARDTARSDTIQKVAAGLLKYKEVKGSYPATDSYTEMITAVKPYITVATKYEDPINKDKYVYGYVASAGNQDFTLLYNSETQNLVIKYTAQQAELDAVKANASANDDKRKRDLENIAYALSLYSSAHVDVNSNQTQVFPPNDFYKSELVPRYMTTLPKDPRTGQDYVYDVGDLFDTFTLKATFDNPPKGMTGYLCTEEECKNY